MVSEFHFPISEKFPWAQEGCQHRLFKTTLCLDISQFFCQQILLGSLISQLQLLQPLSSLPHVPRFIFLAPVSSWLQRNSTMSTSIMKVFLLLAVVVCISQAQRKLLYFLYFHYFTLYFHHLEREACFVYSSESKRKKDLFIICSICFGSCDFNHIIFFPLSFSPELGSGKQCLCSSVRKLDTSNVKDVQIYPATVFCNNVEIV